MPEHLFFHTARGTPISTIYGGFPGDNEAENTISLKNITFAQTMAMAFHWFGVLLQAAVVS